MAEVQPPVIIRIRGYQFQVSAPYSEGGRMGEVEVQQLNDLRADNIRNNVTKVVVDAMALLPEASMLSPETLAELQAKISTYDSRYCLQLKHLARPRVGLIEAEAKAIAEERLEAELRQSGQVPGDVDYPRLLADTMALPQVQALARDRVQAKSQVFQHNLGDLL